MANVTISGEVMYGDGANAVGGVTLILVSMNGDETRRTITDSHGYYRFNNISTSGDYVLRPERPNYTFLPQQQNVAEPAQPTEVAFFAVPTGEVVNPIDTTEYFVRQQYLDMLAREPDEAGFGYWSARINDCGQDQHCVGDTRRGVAAAFFIEQEFQVTGSFIYNLYQGALARHPSYSEYLSDRANLSGPSQLDTARLALTEAFVQRAEFLSKYNSGLSQTEFVDSLIQNVLDGTGVNLSPDRAYLLERYNSGRDATESRSLVLLGVTDNPIFKQAEYNASFVLSQYFSYLRREPDRNGYEYWLNVLNSINASGDNRHNYERMICAFITSSEYQRRFSSIVSRNNGECGQ